MGNINNIHSLLLLHYLGVMSVLHINETLFMVLVKLKKE